jgi:radical SAM protein with 4Fe4S-binding SPASM domain
MKAWASLFVEPDGETRPCCYPSPVYGNLFESSFEEIWNGRAAQQLRQSMIENRPPEQCRNCYEFNRHRPEIMIELLGE